MLQIASRASIAGLAHLVLLDLAQDAGHVISSSHRNAGGRIEMTVRSASERGALLNAVAAAAARCGGTEIAAASSHLGRMGDLRSGVGIKPTFTRAERRAGEPVQSSDRAAAPASPCSRMRWFRGRRRRHSPASSRFSPTLTRLPRSCLLQIVPKIGGAAVISGSAWLMPKISRLPLSLFPRVVSAVTAFRVYNIGSAKAHGAGLAHLREGPGRMRCLLFTGIKVAAALSSTPPWSPIRRLGSRLGYSSL